MLIKTTTAEVEASKALQKQCKHCGTMVPVTLSRDGVLKCTKCGQQVINGAVINEKQRS